MARPLERPWELVGWDEARFSDALARRQVVEERWEGARFFRVERDAHGLVRGTVIAPEGTVPDYPHVPRIFHLARGLLRSFTGPFLAEEKVDGFNVRVAVVGGEVVALTRGGHVCPFSTDRLAAYPAVSELLRRRPDFVICAEIAGPGSPYNHEHPPHVREDVGLFAFDVYDRASGRYLSPGARRAALDEAAVPQVRAFGTFRPEEAARVYDVVRTIEREGCEGVVLKALEGPARVKYVPLSTSARDIAATAGLLGTIPRAFLVNRLVQAAFTIHEWEGRARDEDFRRFGEALLAPLLESIAAVERGAKTKDAPRGEVVEEYEIFMFREDRIEQFLRHLDRSSATVQIKVLGKERLPDGRWRVRFLKRYQKTTGYFLSRLLGTTFID
jgi:putative ATP-dependent DNA ligase